MLSGLNTNSAQIRTTNSTAKTQPVQQTLTPSEQALVNDSRKAIMQTGLSEEYFNVHFKLLKVIDKDSDRRVSWQFSINGYDAVVTDSIGFFTEGTKKVYIHGVTKTLGQTSEIQKTLSRARANRIMKTCIGGFKHPNIQYGPVAGRAQLFLVAQARTAANRESNSERELERERERDEREKQKAGSTSTDTIESEEEEDLPKVVLGSVNLQTGKCTKGAGLIAP
jgi:hypothetical protein